MRSTLFYRAAAKKWDTPSSITTPTLCSKMDLAMTALSSTPAANCHKPYKNDYCPICHWSGYESPNAQPWSSKTCKTTTSKKQLANIAMVTAHPGRNLDDTETRHGDHHRSRNQRRVYASPSYNATCWYCGEQGHISENCRHGGRLQCYKCNKYGHK